MTSRLNELKDKNPVWGQFVRESQTTKGNWEIRVIEAGEGSSGFYPAEVLERDGAKAFPSGTRMFANHDSWEDMFNGGDIRRLIGKTTTDATYRDGALYAEVKISDGWGDFIKEFHDVIGVSINTSGESEIGTVGEYTGPVVTHLENDPYTSIDAVVAPGAGGRFVRALESAKQIVEHGKAPVEASAGNERKETLVELKDIKEALEESNKSLVAALIEALKPAEPEKGEVDFAAAAEAVVAAENLTPKARARVFESVKSGVKVEDAIKAEKENAEEYRKLFEASAPAAPVTVGIARAVEGAGQAGDFSLSGAVGIKVGA